jgi:hypothetical protein
MQGCTHFYENLLGTNLNRDHSINLKELGNVVHNLADLEMSFSKDEVGYSEETPLR